MTLPVLAPRPAYSVSPITPGSRLALVHQESEWAARYPDIKRLYVTERRKLRYVIQYMEREHRFKATKQMYKNRFAKWGFQKYSRGSPAAVQTSKKKARCRKLCRIEGVGSISMPAFPALAPHDGLKLMFLTSVQTWGFSFFESVQSGDGFLASSKDRQHPVDQPRVSLTFKLVIDRLNRGHGELAGRMVRKAFLLLEDLLMLGAPALVWNLLEMMHYMVAQGHAHLFQMLLTHLVALADGRMPDAHPLPTMLRSLRGLIASLISEASNPSSPSSSIPSSSPSFLSNSDGATTTVDPCLLVSTLPSLIGHAWTLNAKMLFDHFDPELIELYCQLFCDSCSINLPGPVADAAFHLLRQIETRQKPSVAAKADLANGYLVNDLLEEKKMLRSLLAPRRDASPPQDYEMLRISNIAALWEHGCLILNNRVGLHGSANTFIGILATLVTARILEEWPAVTRRSSRAKSEMLKVPRISAANVACAIKILMDVHNQTSNSGLGVSSDNVERIRTLVALREYAHGETDPHVIRELWMLEDELIAAGESGEAEEVGRDAYRRLEKYLQEIPVGSA
ncbi:hypothetical protein P7C71_g5343, partial [Lecanoromycetidae sp. Uapishka_2]